jgi:uncharacterized protein (TIGR02594 family)
MTEPVWFTSAKKEIGVHEVGDNGGPDVLRYSQWAHCGGVGMPWCSIFANAMLEVNGIPGTRSPLARSFEHSDHFIRLATPALGCIVTFWRGSPTSGLGHVGFYAGEHNGLIMTLGGNESDMVKMELLNSHGAHFGQFGYYWPKGVELPEHMGPIAPVAAEQGPSTGKVT